MNIRPTATEVAEWFKSAPLHDGMEHDRYVGSVVLIPQVDNKNEDVVGFDEQGAPVTTTRRTVSYIPFVKVEGRIAYFWDYMRLHEDWLGSIEPVTSHYEGSGHTRLALPPGFFSFQEQMNGQASTFIACTMRVKIVKREGSRLLEDGTVIGEPVAIFPPATKVVSTLTKWGPDENALMRSETGAIGRALGMAGMLVVPGSGASTAEDMADASAPQAPVASVAALAERMDADEPLVDQIKDLEAELRTLDAKQYQKYRSWYQSQMRHALEELPERDLKTTVRALQRGIDQVPA